MKWWIKIGCFLTGWNYEILQNCTEASFKHLKKYASALVILMILWGFTGFCFADRYIGTSIFGSIVASLIFIVIVVQIERQIILTITGKRKWMIIVFRVLIALIMSTVGSCILDQIMFGKDIDREKISQITQQVDSLLPIQAKFIDEKLARIQKDIDSISRVNAILNENIAKNPTIKTPTFTYKYEDEIQKDSTIKRVRKLEAGQDHIVENPRIQQVANNDTLLNRLRNQQNEYSNKKITAEEDLRTEINENYGFLSELEIIIKILTTKTEALIFYILIFAFLLFLELFIVFSKFSEKECDYDQIIKYQLDLQIKKLIELQQDKTSQVPTPIG